MEEALNGLTETASRRRLSAGEEESRKTGVEKLAQWKRHISPP
jgi:hypothetical protein